MPECHDDLEQISKRFHDSIPTDMTGVITLRESPFSMERVFCFSLSAKISQPSCRPGRRENLLTVNPSRNRALVRRLVRSVTLKPASAIDLTYFLDMEVFDGAEGGTRTRTSSRTMDFESTASAIPPLRHGGAARETPKPALRLVPDDYTMRHPAFATHEKRRARRDGTESGMP